MTGVVGQRRIQHSVHLKVAKTLTRARPHDDHLPLLSGTATHSLHWATPRVLRETKNGEGEPGCSESQIKSGDGG